MIGLPKIQLPEISCTICLVGKKPKLAFNSRLPMRAKEGLGVVHPYIYGPLEVTSYGGNKYFITFLDEFSRVLWIFPTKSKSEVLQVFKDFKAMAERKSGKLIKILRTYGVREYT